MSDGAIAKNNQGRSSLDSLSLDSARSSGITRRVSSAISKEVLATLVKAVVNLAVELWVGYVFFLAVRIYLCGLFRRHPMRKKKKQIFFLEFKKNEDQNFATGPHFFIPST